MKMKFSIALIAAALVAIGPAWQSLSAEEAEHVAAQSGDPVDAQMAAEGKGLYVHHCSHCHGFNMVSPGTAAYDLRQFPHDQKARFVHSVTTGKNGRMPSWGDLLTPGEIEELWAYVMTGGK